MYHASVPFSVQRAMCILSETIVYRRMKCLGVVVGKKRRRKTKTIVLGPVVSIANRSLMAERLAP